VRKVGKEILAGLKEALAYAQGGAVPGLVAHRVSTIATDELQKTKEPATAPDALKDD
jgi:hypothetical protein